MTDITDDLTTQLAKAIRAAWVDRLDWDELAQGALEFLTSTGRLIPAGGRGLEFSEVEALRSAWEELKDYRVDGYARPHVNQIVKVVGALFPATEPAGPCSRGVCSANNGHEGTCAEASGWAEPAGERRSFPTIQDVPKNTLFRTHGGNGSSLFVRNQSGDLRLCLNAGPEWSKLLRDEDFLPSSGPYMEVPWSKFPQPPADPFAQPAPAEPAEEETKAEYPHRGLGDLTVLGPEIFTNGEVINWRGENFVRQQDPASSSVVPAPTETEWQTWQEVPEGVWFLTNQNIGCWMRRDGDKVTTVTGGWPVCTDSLVAQAPFVAAEEG